MLLTPPTLARYTVGLLIAVAVAFLMWYFRSIVVYILVSALLAIIFKPLVGRLARLRIRGWHLPRWAAALATLILIWVLFVVACTLFVPLVFDKLYQFATLDFGSVLRSVEEPIARMQEYLHDLFALPDERFSLTDSLIQWFKSIFDYDTINTAFSSIVSLTLSAVIAFFSISFITFFFLKDDELFLSMLKAPFPERVHGNIERAMSSVSQLLMRYFTGILSESCILMIVISVTMIFFGMRTQDAFFIGLIMGVMNVVPYAGPLIGGVMSVFMGVVTPIEGMTTGHTMFVIAGSLLIIKGFDDFVLQPTLYSERVKAHPLEIFIVILIAGSLAGIVGMLLAIPSYTVLRSSPRSSSRSSGWYRNSRRKSESYDNRRDRRPREQSRRPHGLPYGQYRGGRVAGCARRSLCLARGGGRTHVRRHVESGLQADRRRPAPAVGDQYLRLRGRPLRPSAAGGAAALHPSGTAVRFGGGAVPPDRGRPPRGLRRRGRTA